MKEKEPTQSKYLRNTKTSKDRTVRLEIVGGVNESERHFLDGCSYLMAGTMSKDDVRHTVYVSEIMAKLIRHIVAQIKKERKDKEK